MVQETKVDGTAVEEFERTLHGPPVRPGDAEYDAARAIWNGSFDRRPALIVRATGVADVVATVNFARENGMLLAVRGGGHSVPGHSTCDDGVVLDLSPMQGVWVDPERRVARAQGGVLWGLLDRETQAHGLAVTGGQITHTGIAGLTLGAGVGWLVRKFGLTCDNLVSAEVVTAAGEVVTASEDENEDLLWGLRGGGGNFGVVTSFEYRLRPLGLVYGGAVLHPAERAAEVLRLFRDVTADAPDELTTYAIFLTAPPAPFVPEGLRGQPAIAIAACYAGDLEAGEDAVRAIREFGPPIVDLFQPMPYTVIQSMFDESAPHGRPYYIKGNNVGPLTDDLIDVLVEQGSATPRPHAELHIGHLRGAVSRVAEDATAYSGRDADYTLIFLSGWDDPAAKDENVSWTRATADATQPFSVGAYINFLEDEGEERIRFAYGSPEKYDRLVALKRKYDPSNLFTLNQNIQP
jgi:FAD/FMN-containing dehydrogenase